MFPLYSEFVQHYYTMIIVGDAGFEPDSHVLSARCSWCGIQAGPGPRGGPREERGEARHRQPEARQGKTTWKLNLEKTTFELVIVGQ